MLYTMVKILRNPGVVYICTYKTAKPTGIEEENDTVLW
jgi:hypothetical protein